MLLRPVDGGTLATGQLSHAWLAGQLARAWGNERFGGVEPHAGVALGAEQHDVGWALFDLEPRWNPETGLPRGFLELTVDDHLEIWVDAPTHLMTTSLHAALVVSMHGSALSEARKARAPDEAGKLQEHIAVEHARQLMLRERLGVSVEQAERTRRQMWTWDGLSLALCHGWHPFVAHHVPDASGELIDVALDVNAGTVDPWPFSTPTLAVECEARRLAERYANEEDMHTGYREAPVETLSFVLAPAG